MENLSVVSEHTKTRNSVGNSYSLNTRLSMCEDNMKNNLEKRSLDQSKAESEFDAKNKKNAVDQSLKEKSESQKKSREERLFDLMIPPKSPFRRTVWNWAIGMAKSQAETSKREKANKENKEIFFLASKIAERIYSILSQELILPLIKLLLSSESRSKLEKFQQEYSSFIANEEKLDSGE